MIEMKHTGLYVNDLNKVTLFYKNVFNMKLIVDNEKDYNVVLDELLKCENASICVSKLITEKGVKTGSGDMLELIQVLNGKADQSPVQGDICKNGMMHLCFGVDDIDLVVSNIKAMGGEIKTQILLRENGNKFCFATDIEGNWIELIQRNS